MDLLKPFRKGKERFECKQNEAGKVECRSYRENDDGTRIELAGMDFEFTASPECKPIATSMFENESNALAKLEKNTVTRLRQKCATNRPSNKPADY